MAILAQRTLHVASTPNNAAGVIRGRRPSGRAESSERVKYRGKLCGKVCAVSSSFHELPRLQLVVSGGGFPGSKFLSWEKWHWFGNVGINCQSPQATRARRGDDSGSSPEEEAKDKDKDTLEEQTDMKIEGDEQGADSQESGGEVGEVIGEEAEGETSAGSGEDEADHNETSLQNEDSKTGFWRKIWEPGQKDEDNTLGPDEELLLQDLESLTFDWRGLLDPTWENLLALGFTALLTLALLKIFSQLILVVITILLSALKYTVLAALLLGLLIFLL